MITLFSPDSHGMVLLKINDLQGVIDVHLTQEQASELGRGLLEAVQA